LIKNYADNFHRTVTYAYDADGNRANITYPSGKDYSYGYTGRNQLWSVLDNSSGIYQAAFTYDKAGNMITRYVGNNWVVTDASQRDSLNRVTHVEHRLVGAPRSFNYQFDARSNRTSIQRDGATPEVQAYDATQQLTQTVTNGSAVTMVYDNNGNRTSTNGLGGYASDNLNQYTMFKWIGATYDTNGNLETYDGWKYTYDVQGGELGSRLNI
jgi:YD repeat-containing protein